MWLQEDIITVSISSENQTQTVDHVLSRTKKKEDYVCTIWNHAESKTKKRNAKADVSSHCRHMLIQNTRIHAQSTHMNARSPFKVQRLTCVRETGCCCSYSSLGSYEYTNLTILFSLANHLGQICTSPLLVEINFTRCDIR